MTYKKHKTNRLWDLFCLLSIIGIWPRFIEPKLLFVSRYTRTKKTFPDIKIAHISDLHLLPHQSDAFLKKIDRKIQAESPSLILFTGDFLCYGKMREKRRLKKFLNKLRAPLGSFAILGNHDYEKRVGLREDGVYDVIEKGRSEVISGFSRLLNPIQPLGQVEPSLSNLPPNQELLEVIEQSPVTLLNNETVQITNSLNITGLGEHTAGQCDVENAYSHYNEELPGITLCHNPDALPYVTKKPGDIILCGHTHGAQVNLPWLRYQLILQEHPEWIRGVHQINNKWIYINRGLGSVMPFRFFSPPELMILTIRSEK